MANGKPLIKAAIPVSNGWPSPTLGTIGRRGLLGGGTET
jgi:hypothetical protein